MKKSLFIMALGAIALTSCSQDEIIEVQKDAISFAAFSDNASRATETTTATIESFKVWGVVNENGNNISYFDPDGVVLNVTANQMNIASGYYWPTGTMDFYAVSPANIANASLGTPSAFATNSAGIADVVVANANTQTDILYALTTGQTKTTADVPLSFQHALSQVVFKVKIAEDVQQKIEVKINDVTLSKLVKKGSFAFPKTATTSDGVGSWTLSEEAEDLLDYMIAPNATIENYTEDGEGALVNNVSAETEPMLVLPQAKAIAATQSAGVWDSNGLFILDTTVAAKYDREGIAGDYETSINLVNTPTYIPVTFNWEPGKKYIYTIVYTAAGNGGVDQNGNNQLLPIKFSVEVEDFAATTPAETPVPLQ